MLLARLRAFDYVASEANEVKDQHNEVSSWNHTQGFYSERKFCKNIEHLLDYFVVLEASVLLAGGNKVQHWHGPNPTQFRLTSELNNYYRAEGDLFQGTVFRLEPWRDVSDSIDKHLSEVALGVESASSKSCSIGIGGIFKRSPSEIRRTLYTGPCLDTSFQHNIYTLYQAVGAGWNDVHSPRWYLCKIRGAAVNELNQLGLERPYRRSENVGAKRDLLVCLCFSKKDPAAVRIGAISCISASSVRRLMGF